MRPVAPEDILYTPRIALEPLLPVHAAPLFEHLQDERLYTYIPQDPPRSREALEERYRKLSARHSPDGMQVWLNWVVRLRSSGLAIGTLEATVYPDFHALLAYIIFGPFQRQHYAKEGCQRVIEHLAHDYHVALVAAEIDTRNRASVALIESLGFARVAVHPNADFFKGSHSDEYHYELRLA